MKDLDPAALDCLAALVDAGSFERAAQSLSITQSAVSQRLRALETQVGQLLVVRSRPLRLTEPGKVLLRFARQWQAMQADVARELGAAWRDDERVAVAVNADSLATWVLPALDGLVQRGHREGFGLELIADDQDFTHDWLREGRVLACVSSVAQALRGCRVTPLGVMRYVAVASPGFLRDHLATGLHAGSWPEAPFLVFNRKDDMQAQWVSKAFGIRTPRLRARYVPSSEACVRAIQMGWGIGVLPELQVRELIEAGDLVPLLPEVTVDVPLHWHQWKLSQDEHDPAREARHGLLDEVERAMVGGAARWLRPPVSTQSGG
ncbi:MAG: LysR family transcriptional regulator ArgP [Burkholderiaceae bacterium]|jgi:LysR family transcriptional regulator (chromosome initiation inhibitor)|nr:MAG: LysR family transcriptional regulator ArgP [Burkholderiaceae bacterium]